MIDEFKVENFLTRRDQITKALTTAMENLGFTVGYEPDPCFLVKAQKTGSPEWGAVRLMSIGDWAFSQWPSAYELSERIHNVLETCD